jgi:hypothetical protein
LINLAAEGSRLDAYSQTPSSRMLVARIDVGPGPKLFAAQNSRQTHAVSEVVQT